MAGVLQCRMAFAHTHIIRHPSSASSAKLAFQVSHQLGANNHNSAQRFPKHPSEKAIYANKEFELCATPKLLSNNSNRTIVLGTGSFIFLALAFTRECHAAAGVLESQWETIQAIIAQEPKNALSLPTWAIHVASVVEWVVAMALVWQYGDKPDRQAWKGLSWGMVPLLGGALCACTWHFFYNAESLEILVAIQGALTVIGNITMMVAAYRIYESTKGDSEAS